MRGLAIALLLVFTATTCAVTLHNPLDPGEPEGLLLSWLLLLRPTLLRAVQHGGVVIDANPKFVSIRDVDLSQAFTFCSQTVPAASQSNIAACLLTGENALTIEAGSANNQEVTWAVVEFASGVRVQRGGFSMPAVANEAFVAISSVDLTKSFVLVQVRTGNVDLRDRDEQRLIQARLTETNRVQFLRGEPGIDIVVTFQVVEMIDAVVQSGTTGITAETASASVAPGNTSQRLLFFSTRASPTTNGIENSQYVRGSLLTDSILFRRAGTIGSVEVSWFLLETPGLHVEHGSAATTGAHDQVVLSAPLSSSFPPSESIVSASVTILDPGLTTSDSDADSGLFSGKILGESAVQFRRYSAESPRIAEIDFAAVRFRR